MGRRGLVGLFVKKISSLQRQGSKVRNRPSPLLFSSLTFLEQTRVKKCDEGTGGPYREKKGGSGEGGSGDDDSFRKWNGYEKGERRFEDGKITCEIT